jgi:hypothetical protein
MRLLFRPRGRMAILAACGIEAPKGFGLGHRGARSRRNPNRSRGPVGAGADIFVDLSAMARARTGFAALEGEPLLAGSCRKLAKWR